MEPRLHELDVLALDCQATGATPAHGDLLEIAWAVCAARGVVGSVHSRFVVPRSRRPVSRAVRELTGWSEAVLGSAVAEHEAWSALRAHALPLAGSAPARTVIHFARFELPFLHDLHERCGPRGEALPFDVVCLHAIAARLFPDLPRRNIRALSGYLGHSAELVRRSAGHVEATAFIWSALLPELAQRGIDTWSALRDWLAQPVKVTRAARRSFPFARERRRSLPDAPGVYRFLRCNGDVLYVGKAASMRKRVTSHFGAADRVGERALELLTQVHDVDCTETASLLEAALLEADEIKRLDPAYNVQLRGRERSAWFASGDFGEAVPRPDGAHRVGPLPSQHALAPLWALIALAGGDDSPRLRAAALAVPAGYLPDEPLFLEGWRVFAPEYLGGPPATPARRVVRASRALWIARGRAEPELDPSAAELAPDAWDLQRVRRRLERSLVQTGLLVRRARVLCLLADATIAFREREMDRARALVIAQARIAERRALASIAALADLPARPLPALALRQAAFDAAAYDRMRVLSTELRRVHQEGGEVAVRAGRHLLTGERLARAMSAI
jgi:DNA polymerase III subunit epsilon